MFKPHFGICICHNKDNLIVVKSGLCYIGNEEKKDRDKPKRIVAREEKKNKTFLNRINSNSNSCSDLEVQLDAIFSLYIRTLNSVNGKNKCFTCDLWFLIKELECGHFVKRAHKSLRWEITNCHPQCNYCNQGLDGNYGVYKAKMIEKYGHKHLDWLTQIKNTTKRMGVYEYKVLIDLFGNKLKEITSK